MEKDILKFTLQEDENGAAGNDPAGDDPAGDDPAGAED
jgi:hypothetical protein